MKKNHIKSLLSAFIIFLFIYESISYIKYSSYENSDKKIEKINELKEPIVTNEKKEVDFNEHFAFVECLEKDILADCENINSKPIKVLGVSIEKNEIEKQKNEYKIFKDLMRSNIIIMIIYLFLIYTLAKQIYLFLLVKQGNSLDEIDFHNAEWNINTAPMFGLLGTFFSIAILLTNTATQDISTVLLGNFFDAVMTTIMGIVFYIINFKLKIDIYPLVKFNE